MFCTGCGTQSTDSDVFCGGCGTVQRSTDRREEAHHASNVFHVGKAMQQQAIPDGVKGWSWGAFLLNWIWAIGNNTWIGLLALIPVVNVPVMIWLGVSGRELAWRNRQWNSVEHFNEVQRKWSQWAVGIALTYFGIIFICVFITIFAGVSQGTVEPSDSVVQQSGSATRHVPGQG